MESLKETLRSAPALTKALALAVGGMAGVFITLLLFFLLIVALERLSRKKS